MLLISVYLSYLYTLEGSGIQKGREVEWSGACFCMEGAYNAVASFTVGSELEWGGDDCRTGGD